MALGFSDALRASGKMDVVSTPQPHEPYGVFLGNTTVTLQNGTKLSAWESHRACMGKGEKSLCDASSFPGSVYEDNWTAENAKTLLGRRPANKPFFIQVNRHGGCAVLCRPLCPMPQSLVVLMLTLCPSNTTLVLTGCVAALSLSSAPFSHPPVVLLLCLLGTT